VVKTFCDFAALRLCVKAPSPCHASRVTRHVPRPFCSPLSSFPSVKSAPQGGRMQLGTSPLAAGPCHWNLKLPPFPICVHLCSSAVNSLSFLFIRWNLSSVGLDLAPRQG
jgi:hypothetical protein